MKLECMHLCNLWVIVIEVSDRDDAPPAAILFHNPCKKPSLLRQLRGRYRQELFQTQVLNTAWHFVGIFHHVNKPRLGCVCERHPLAAAARTSARPPPHHLHFFLLSLAGDRRVERSSRITVSRRGRMQCTTARANFKS